MLGNKEKHWANKVKFNTTNIFCIFQSVKTIMWHKYCHFFIIIPVRISKVNMPHPFSFIWTALSWHCELAAVASGQWCQATSATKGGGTLQRAEGGRWQWWAGGLAKVSTAVLDHTAASDTRQWSQWGGLGNTTDLEEGFITMRGQWRHSGTVHLIIP